MAEVMSWQTYKKRYDPLISQVQDSSKPWSFTVVGPTMRNQGFHADQGNDIMHDERKPKQILLEDFSDIINKSEIVVYHQVIPTRSYAGYYEYLDIFYM